MAERLDILVPNYLPQFTVNNALLVVPTVYPGSPPANPCALFNGDGLFTFEKGDNFSILSAGVIMPLSFQVDRSGSAPEPALKINFGAVGITTGKQYLLKEISAATYGGFIYFPAENYDTPLDVFVDVNNQALVTGSNLKNERFLLTMLVFAIGGPTGTQISMAGVPSALNTTVQKMVPYAKILHNYPLV